MNNQLHYDVNRIEDNVMDALVLDQDILALIRQIEHLLEKLRRCLIQANRTAEAVKTKGD